MQLHVLSKARCVYEKWTLCSVTLSIYSVAHDFSKINCQLIFLHAISILFYPVVATSVSEFSNPHCQASQF